MKENKSQEKGKSGQGEKREIRERGREKPETMVRKRQRGREAEQLLELGPWRAPPIPPIHLPHLPGLTVPAWGCPHCRTSHTHGSAGTRGRSGSGRSSGTVALSARCRATVREVSDPTCLLLPLCEPRHPAITLTSPVVPASAAPIWVPSQVGSKQEAGVGGLAPGTLA